MSTTNNTKPAVYELRTRENRYYLAEDGTVLYDFQRQMGPFSGEWRIIGIGKRHHSRNLISISEAANGADFGQGWIHDIDHGTRRMWAMPTTRRAIWLTRLA